MFVVNKNWRLGNENLLNLHTRASSCVHFTCDRKMIKSSFNNNQLLDKTIQFNPLDTASGGYCGSYEQTSRIDTRFMVIVLVLLALVHNHLIPYGINRITRHAG